MFLLLSCSLSGTTALLVVLLYLPFNNRSVHDGTYVRTNSTLTISTVVKVVLLYGTAGRLTS